MSLRATSSLGLDLGLSSQYPNLILRSEYPIGTRVEPIGTRVNQNSSIQTRISTELATENTAKTL